MVALRVASVINPLVLSAQAAFACPAVHRHDTAMSGPPLLQRQTDGRLLFTDESRSGVPVRVSPAFPLTDPGRWLSFRDAQGVELAFVPDVDALHPADAAVVIEELQHRQFVPMIHRILQANSTPNGLEMDVETDRGPTRLLLESEEQIRRLGESGIVLTDRAGIRYLIPALRQLDKESRRRLERFY